jgi:tetratricopeptide (TPR) repeat protein
MSRYEEAIEDFTSALGCDHVGKALRKDILSYRATAYLKDGQYENALADCQRLAEEYSMDANSYFLT